MQVPPPPRFRAPSGVIRDVALNTNNPFRDSRGRSAAQKAGLLYERRVQTELLRLFGDSYFNAPLLHFHDDSGARTCIPDGLLIRRGKVGIFEIKYQHMPEAWWQLRRLYEPVVRAYLPGCEVALVEICRSYDAAVPFPESPVLIYELEKHELLDGSFGVYRWKL